MELHIGAQNLATRHLSIRVPWHDTGWDGRICKRPSGNSSCLVLKNIHENRDDRREDQIAGSAWHELETEDLPPCVVERAGFMRSKPSHRFSTAPYEFAEAHKHIKPTRLQLPEYAAMAVPFRWMLRTAAEELIERYDLQINWPLEDRADELLDFSDGAAWFQQSHNQRVMLDTFFSAVTPEESLVFFYAKDVPLVETGPGDRILIGAGRVTRVGQPTRYDFRSDGELRPWLWERAVHHSIRPDFSDGFLLPYHALLEKYPAKDLTDFVALTPEGHWEEFSYASEHVSHDGAIASLMILVKAVERCQQEVPGHWDKVLHWLDARLNDAWRLRGPCPGLGSALTAFGVERGTLLAHRIAGEVSSDRDPWDHVEAVFKEAKDGRGQHRDLITKQRAEAFCRLASISDDEAHRRRIRLLRVLSSFEINADQATRFYEPAERERAGISVTDDELLANPYLLFELDRHHQDPITIGTVDRGVFSDKATSTQDSFPVDPPLFESTDSRRVRALSISVLETRSTAGDTILPASSLVRAVRDFPVTPPCSLTTDLLPVVKEHFEPAVREIEMKGSKGFQLVRLSECGELIRTTVQKRVKGRRHEVSGDWRSRLDIEFGEPSAAYAEQDLELEQIAREEKAAALEELASARLSVLAGPAGTGKTSLLKVLVGHPQIKEGGILLLAPTGKARVQLQEYTELEAKTIAQFLVPSGRYVPQTMRYRMLPDAPRYEGAKTVIIDEASMLTEEQLAATIDALKGVQRLILVGDPRQLPPIGSGRPFVDVIRYLAPGNLYQGRIRVGRGTGYCGLTVHRRQIGDERPDLELAEWFSRDTASEITDEVWTRLVAGEPMKHLQLIQWNDEDELHGLLLEVLVEELELSGRRDHLGFDASLGANVTDYDMAFFNRGAAEEYANSWQILTPSNKRPYGVRALNRLVKTTFRSIAHKWASEGRRVARPLGTDEIVYGDKVINVYNDHRQYWDGQQKKGFVANGEIGLVIGPYVKKQKNKPRLINVEFSSQAGRSYTYRGRDFGEDKEYLELAFAITVHKAQGSQFGTTVLILPNPSPLLSVELLYTALTRQQDKVILLHQGDIADLRSLSSPSRSETARRLTNLFEVSIPAEDDWLDDQSPLDSNLIHKTVRGEAVRSKSEVIVANLLNQKGIDYKYEEPFVGGDGRTVWPDFTCEDADTGQLIIWEHLGLLHTQNYRKKWERKKKWYESNGVTEEGESEAMGTLITSRDDEHGGIDATRISQLIEENF